MEVVSSMLGNNGLCIRLFLIAFPDIPRNKNVILSPQMVEAPCIILFRDTKCPRLIENV